MPVLVPIDLWKTIVKSHHSDAYERPVGRDHSHCGSCNACNDGGCGKGTHEHRSTCHWKKLDVQMEAVTFDELDELVGGSGQECPGCIKCGPPIFVKADDGCDGSGVRP